MSETERNLVHQTRFLIFGVVPYFDSINKFIIDNQNFKLVKSYYYIWAIGSATCHLPCFRYLCVIESSSAMATGRARPGLAAS